MERDLVRHVDRDNLHALWAWSKVYHWHITEALIRRAYSMYTCSMIIQDVADMTDESEDEVTSHKEEKLSRISADAKDKEKNRDKLMTCKIR